MMVYKTLFERDSNLPQGCNDLSLSLAVIDLHKHFVSLDLCELGGITHCFFSVLFSIDDRGFILFAIFTGVFVVSQVLWLDF